MNFTQGMLPDKNLYSSVDGSWAMGKNIRLVNGVIEVDYGSVSVGSIGGHLVGVCNTGEELFIFTSEEESDVDRIYKFDGTTVSTILTADLGLSYNVELDVVYKYNMRNELILAWVDGVNKLKVLNVTTLPFINGVTGINNVIANPNDLGILSVSPEVKIPYIKLGRSSGGSLGMGVYQIAIRYKYKDVASKWIIYSERILLFGKSVAVELNVNPDTSLNPSSPTMVNYIPQLSSSNANNSLLVTLTGLDSKYDTIDIAVLKSLLTGGFESTCGIITNIPISSYISMTQYINGEYNSYVELDVILESIFSIYKPKAITNFRDKLLIANYETLSPATNIASTITSNKLKWIVTKGNSKNITFKWGEVYAIYAAYVYVDGSLSQFEPLVGRELDESDRAVYTPITELNMLGDDPKQFHILSTVKNVVQDDDWNLIGDFGAWENANEYYEDGSTKVRHFRFPHKSILYHPTSLDHTWTGWGEDDWKEAKLGITIDLSEVILPDNVQGVTFAYAKRDLGNCTALDDCVYSTVAKEEDGPPTTYGSLTPYLLVNNRFVPSNPYLYFIHSDGYVLSDEYIQMLPDLSFKVEHNTVHDNEYCADRLHTTLVMGVLKSRAVTIMNDVRDTYNSRYSQSLVYLTYCKNEDIVTSYNGDVYTSIGYFINYSYRTDLNTTLFNFDIRQGIITSPIINDFLDISGIPFYEGGLLSEFEKGVQTLSVDRYYVRLKGTSELCINKPFILVKDTDKLYNKHYNDILNSYQRTGEFDNWYLFNPNDYYTIPNINGSIYQLISYGNALYIRTNKSLYIAKIRDTFDMTNGSVGIKSGDLFDQYPQELLPTSQGFIQGNSKLATWLGKLGVVIVDISTSSIYILGEELVDLTITNKPYFKSIFTSIDNSHLSSLSGVCIAYNEEYNRLFITIGEKVLTFDLMSKFLISEHNIGKNYMFSLLGKPSPYYININNGYKIYKLSNSTYPTESYIDVSLSSEELLTFGLNDVSWVTVGGEMNTIDSIAIWSEYGATGVIDISRIDIVNDATTGNTSFDLDGVYRFNEIFNRVINTSLPFYSGSIYDPQFTTDNIDVSDNKDLVASHFKIRLYLKKVSRVITNRNCKLKTINVNPKQYITKY